MRLTLDKYMNASLLHIIKITNPVQLEAQPSTVKRILSMTQLPGHFQEHGVESFKPLIPPLIRASRRMLMRIH